MAPGNIIRGLRLVAKEPYDAMSVEGEENPLLPVSCRQAEPNAHWHMVIFLKAK